MARLVILAAVWFVLATPQAAFAKGIPIIWGNDSTIKVVGELPEGAREEIVKELKQDVSVGYMYDRFHIYYADLWTWNGRYVLFKDDNYWDGTPAQWNGMLGGAPEEKFGKPWSYTFPLGLTLLVVGISAWIIVPRVLGRNE